MELVEKMLNGAPSALSRLISYVETDAGNVSEMMREIYPYTGKAYTVGVTGPPGGGKSTIVDRLTKVARERGLSVGIIAVDPTSPFSHGAILGDRIRMQQHYLDKSVFIRSMATRGSRGGLPRAARGAIKLLDAFGKDLILVETVGVGQTELDIMEAADTVLVVLVPEAGDAIQTMKAGLMEIADVFAINKADRSGADRLLAELRSTIEMGSKNSDWKVPVLLTQANNNVGIEELYREMEKHRKAQESIGKLTIKRQKQREREFLQIIGRRVRDEFLYLMEKDEALVAVMGKVGRGELDPYSAAVEVIKDERLIQSWILKLTKGGN
jgi:LAO/AO transport system kinase